MNSDNSNSTSQELLINGSSRSSSNNSSFSSLANSSRSGSINSSYSNNSSRALVKTSVASISSNSSDDSRRALVKTSVTSISSNSSDDSRRALVKTSVTSMSSRSSDDNDDIPSVFISRLARTLSLDSSIPEMPSRIQTMTVPFVPTHECHFIPGKYDSIDKDNHITKGLYMDRGKDDQVLLHDKLHNPIWIKPSTGSHTCLDKEACKSCLGSSTLTVNPERRPDFTLNHSYRSPRKKPRRFCKCGTITILTCIFSLFVMLLILGFVVYTETVIKKPTIRIHYKM